MKNVVGRLLAWLVANLVCAAVVSACGGGGGGGGGGGSDHNTGTQAPVTDPVPSGAGGLTAPVLSSQPANANVAVGDEVHFAVTVSNADASPTSYQWELSVDGVNWVPIEGATAANFSVEADPDFDGLYFHVVVTNAQGASTSQAAVLGVVQQVGVVLGRSWTPALSLEENATQVPVTSRAAGIDDSGRVTVVFVKNDGKRDVIYATHGSPNAPGKDPTWTTPVPIDLVGGVAVSTLGYPSVDVKVTPGGNAVAWWRHSCTSTRVPGPLPCGYYYAARYSAQTGRWAEPEALVDFLTNDISDLVVNDRGDLVLFADYRPQITKIKTLYLRTAAEATLRVQQLDEFPAASFEKFQLHMDDAGHLMMAAQYRPAATSQIWVFRGTAATGLTQSFVLDDGANSNALLSLSQVGRNGQQVVYWQQHSNLNEGLAATSATADGTFTVSQVGAQPSTALTIDDEGQALFWNGTMSWSPAKGWLSTGYRGQIFQPFFEPGVRGNGVISRSGDALYLHDGATDVYDHVTRTEVPKVDLPSILYVLGFSANVLGFSDIYLLSNSGIGFALLENDYSVLPAPDATAGVRQKTKSNLPQTNLWGVFYK
jgi:hypothetical protein